MKSVVLCRHLPYWPVFERWILGFLPFRSAAHKVEKIAHWGAVYPVCTNVYFGSFPLQYSVRFSDFEGTFYKRASTFLTDVFSIVLMCR